MNEPVSTWMKQPVVPLDMDHTVEEVDQLFATHGLSWAPVLERDKGVVGVISTADLLQFHARGGNAAQVRAWQMCTYKPISVDASTPLVEVARQMIARKVHHVVVTQGGKVAGVMSSLDFVQAFVAGR